MGEDSEKSVLERVTGVIEEVLKVDRSKVTPTTNIKDDLGADSVDLLTLVFALEEEFGGKLPDDVIMDIKTVDDAIGLIEHEIVKSK